MRVGGPFAHLTAWELVAEMAGMLGVLDLAKADSLPRGWPLVPPATVENIIDNLMPALISEALSRPDQEAIDGGLHATARRYANRLLREAHREDPSALPPEPNPVLPPRRELALRPDPLPEPGMVTTTMKSANKPASTPAPSDALVRVPFHGDELLAQRDERGVWVIVKRVCEAIGLTEQRQMTKLKEKAWAVTTMMVAAGPDGKNYEMLALHLDALPMWLATIDASRCAPVVRAKIERYQMECAKVLRDHFFGIPSAELAALRAEVAELREELRAPRVIAGPLPVAGVADAKVYVLGPLRQIAKKRARLEGADPRSLRKTLENDLREAVNYPQVGGASWDMLPREKLAVAHRKLTRWQRDVDKRTARMLDGAPPKQLPLRQAG